MILENSTAIIKEQISIDGAREHASEISIENIHASSLFSRT